MSFFRGDRDYNAIPQQRVEDHESGISPHVVGDPCRRGDFGLCQREDGDHGLLGDQGPGTGGRKAARQVHRPIRNLC